MIKNDSPTSDFKPCTRCEAELPLASFPHPESDFCAACSDEIVKIVGAKYSAIEAAHFRAKLRRRSREAMDELRRRPPSVPPTSQGEA